MDFGRAMMSLGEYLLQVAEEIKEERGSNAQKRMFFSQVLLLLAFIDWTEVFAYRTLVLCSRFHGDGELNVVTETLCVFIYYWSKKAFKAM